MRTPPRVSSCCGRLPQRREATAAQSYPTTGSSCREFATLEGTWVPLVMLERIVMGAILILQSALEDMRKLSPELYLPEILPDSHMTSWWEDLCDWKNSPVHRTLVAFGRPTTDDVGPFPELLMNC